MYDIIVVGAGPAGLTSAIYARRANKKVLVLEAKSYGGQIINANNIENYPGEPHISGIDFATKIYEQVINLGAEVKFERVNDVISKDKLIEVSTNKNKYSSKALIIATGSDNRKLGLDREEELTGRGVSYCATCDGNFYRNKDVAVVGNTSVAVEDAIYLSDIVNKVYLINKKDTFEVDIDELKNKNNIEIINNAKISKLIGDKKLESIEVNDKVINVDGLFIAVGRVPETQNFTKLFNVDSMGYVISDDCHTNIEGIFVAGDNRAKSLRQLVTATSDGAIAATEAIKYINGMGK